MALQPLASTEQVEAYSKSQILGADPRLGDSLNGVSTAIRRYCGWHIAPAQTETVVLDGPGGRLLSLPSLHVTDVSAIAEDDVPVETSNYRWSVDGSVKKKSGRWSDEFRSVTVTYTHGFDYADVADLTSVVLSVIVRQLSSPTGATREQAGQVSVSWAVTAPGVSGGIALLEHERSILDHYRIVTV